MIDNKYINSWGLYPWFSGDDPDLIYPDDLELTKALTLHGKVFYCSEQLDEFIVLKYGNQKIRVKPDLFKQVRPVRFAVGTSVTVVDSPEKTGIVVDIGWHHKNDEPIYYLSFNGKKSSKRYSESEISPSQ